MVPEHILGEPVKAYLLRKLSNEEAGGIEERYFTDRSFFRRMQEAEFALIQDYLEGRLMPSDSRLFELRYLNVPDLKRKLEEVRLKLSPARASPMASRPVWYRPALAACLIGTVALGVWVYRYPKPAQVAQVARVGPSRLLPAVVVNLTPGLLKGSTKGTAEFRIPPPNVLVSKNLELPGQRLQVACTVHVSVADSDGRRMKIWASTKPVHSLAT